LIAIPQPIAHATERPSVSAARLGGMLVRLPLRKLDRLDPSRATLAA
jgi:hypothetical protein